MALTNIKRSTDPVVRRASGYLSGTYTAATVTSTSADGSVVIASGVMTISLGWAPKYFKVINVTDRVTQEWFEGMNQGDFLETAANGDATLETDDKVVVAVSNSGSAPVVQQPANTITVTFNGGAVTDNDTAVWVAEG